MRYAEECSRSSSTEADDRFFSNFFDYFGCDYLNFEKKICLPYFPGGHFIRGLITKS